MTKAELLNYLKPNQDQIWFAVSSEKEPDLFTKAIQKFQGTKYSHALAIYWSFDLHDFVIANARGQASQLDTVDQFYGIGDEVDILFEKKVTRSQWTRFVKTVVELDGIDYSETQIFNIGLEAIFGVHGNSNDADGVICSEYADRLSLASGLKSASGIVNKPQELLTPKDNVKCWEYLQSSVFWRVK